MVLVGSPQRFLYTPEVRPAHYYKGSGTNRLVFRYSVQRGDACSSLALLHTNTTDVPYGLTETLTLTNFFGTSTMLRTAQIPTLPASRQIPYYLNNTGISIDSTIPRIINFTTSTRNGVYSVGEKVDFQVTFNYPVATGKAFNSTPILILNIGPINRIGYIIAPYASGSGTPTIVFTYTIQAIDYQLHHRPNLLQFDAPIFQPLRIQHTFTQGDTGSYLRRNAANPLINVLSTVFPPNAGHGNITTHTDTTSYI